MEKIRAVEQLEAFRKEVLDKQGTQTRSLTLCAGTGCRAYGTMEIVEAFHQELK